MGSLQPNATTSMPVICTYVACTRVYVGACAPVHTTVHVHACMHAYMHVQTHLVLVAGDFLSSYGIRKVPDCQCAHHKYKDLG
jgi:hypothetical protein